MTHNSRMPRTASIVLAMALLASPPARALDEPAMPSNAGPLYYLLGGGQPLPRPASNFTTTRITANLRAGVGYTCGQFNFQQNLQQMVNQFTSRVRQLPGQLTGAVQAAIFALPGYLLNRANPSLYNVLTKTLDESANLFRLGVKSCQQIEQDVRQNRDPYKNLVTASIADRWNVNAGSGDLTVDLAREDTMENAADDGIVLADGNRYGGSGQPVAAINENVAIVGYNILLGRALDDRNAPTGDAAESTLARMWPTPQDAADWIADVAGSYTADLTEDGDATARAGRGLRPQVESLTTTLRAALEKAVNEDDFDDLRENITVMQIGSNIVRTIRDASPFDAAIMMDRLSMELAVAELQNRTLTAERLLYAGLASPYLVQSTAQTAVNDRIRQQTLPQLRAALDSIRSDLELRQQTLARTTQVILDYRASKAAATAAPGIPQPNTNPVTDGNVNQ
ncbi:MAG TPA: hypothetical protein ENK05_09670 [Gammaproteobacteria bacterium]|nr:hypothetical protein [Gammaproteobacteria bacterium]